MLYCSQILKKIPAFYGTFNSHHGVYQSLPLLLNLSQINVVHGLPTLENAIKLSGACLKEQRNS
jgi:hypothetical protein